MAAKEPRNPRINYFTNLPDDVVVTNVVQYENCDELCISYKPPANRKCPECGSIDCSVKDSSVKQTVRHTPVNRRGIILTFHKRRLDCKNCGASFTENPDWLYDAQKMTNALFYLICVDLTRMLSLRAIAYDNGVSEAIVTKVLQNIEYGRPVVLPETLCIDEFKGTSGEWNQKTTKWDVNKYHCNISDGDSGVVIDILPQIREEFLKPYFRKYSPAQRSRVKYFCCDMHNGFISIARALFPNAHICIDMFHVIRRINDTVDEIRMRFQRTVQNSYDVQDRQKYFLLKHAARSLLTSEIKQKRLRNPNNARRLEKLNALFSLYPELATAYAVLQDFHYICTLHDEPFLRLQKSSLTEWISHCLDSNIPELVSLGNSIRHWRGYIQNTWQYRRTNSVCEGLNNKIKVLKRVSYGLHSFDTFRKRVLLTCGSIRLADEPFTIFREKRCGKKVRL